jgi:hypothetical protein
MLVKANAPKSSRFQMEAPKSSRFQMESVRRRFTASLHPHRRCAFAKRATAPRENGQHKTEQHKTRSWTLASGQRDLENSVDDERGFCFTHIVPSCLDAAQSSALPKTNRASASLMGKSGRTLVGLCGVSRARYHLRICADIDYGLASGFVQCEVSM